MEREEYVDLITEQPWKKMQQHFDSLDPVDVAPLCDLDIDPQQWIDFTVQNFHNAKQEWEMPKDHYPTHAKEWATINQRVGRNKHNTFELNYGMLGDTNEKLKELLGTDNIAKLNVDPSSILIRLLVKFPGHGIAWHQDDNGSYKKKFPHVNIDSTKSNAQGELKRLWWSVDHWQDGHAFQISKTVLTHWQPGEVYHIPWGHGHASSNFGYRPQYSVSFTGLIYNK
jgi:hypothetical protein